MVTKQALLASVLFMIGCMAAPDQPPLSVRERVFFAEVEKKWSCKIHREIDWKLLRVVDRKAKGGYFIEFTEIPCSGMFHKEPEHLSFKMATIIFREVLERDKKYDELEIVFRFQDECRQRNSASYEYSDAQLN